MPSSLVIGISVSATVVTIILLVVLVVVSKKKTDDPEELVCSTTPCPGGCLLKKGGTYTDCEMDISLESTCHRHNGVFCPK
ncbi:MAG: hypothetical protein CL450_09110 [Acidimicrobiaceae bacterium]|nr:hypothetical protein [Acidimicrobiaceae bacterium]